MVKAILRWVYLMMLIPEIRYLHQISLFLICQWVDPPASKLVRLSMIHPVEDVSVLIWFMQYISTCWLYQWVGPSAGWLVPVSVNPSFVSVSALIWFIKYMYKWNLQLLNNNDILYRAGITLSGLIQFV